MKMNAICGLDIGNGYTKAKIAIDGVDYRVDIPSCVAYTTGSDIADQLNGEIVLQLPNECDVSLITRAIPSLDAGRIFVGKRALRASTSIRSFNLDDGHAKSDDSLSVMLALTTIASVAFEAAFAKKHELVHEISVDAVCALALPIEDYARGRAVYVKKFTDEAHRVIIHNFEHDVEVTINFVSVQVLAEGASAQFAISRMGEDYLNQALVLARMQGAPLDEAYTAKTVLAAQNTVGIDIGEGTVNFPVFRDGKLSPEASRSISVGWGTVLTRTCEKLRSTPYAFDSRKDLGDFLVSESVTPRTTAIRAVIDKVLDAEIRVFVTDVMDEFASIMRHQGMRLECVYVFGGGANSVRKYLEPKLFDAVSLDGTSAIPVIYMDSTYSRDLNREGLFEVARLAYDIIKSTK